MNAKSWSNDSFDFLTGICDSCSDGLTSSLMLIMYPADFLVFLGRVLDELSSQHLLLLHGFVCMI